MLGPEPYDRRNRVGRDKKILKKKKEGAKMELKEYVLVSK